MLTHPSYPSNRNIREKLYKPHINKNVYKNVLLCGKVNILTAVIIAPFKNTRLRKAVKGLLMTILIFMTPVLRVGISDKRGCNGTPG